MKGFAPEFQTPEQYIIDITYKIWEERGVGRIYDWYAADGPVRTPHGVTETAEAVVRGTLETLHLFPDRELLAEDVIIGPRGEAFLSSHRVRSTATHLGEGAFGPPTRRPITTLTMADCLCRENQIVEEWLVRDQAHIALQLSLDPVALGRALGEKSADAYRIGNDAMRQRWRDPDGFTTVGDQDIAGGIVKTYESIWADKRLQVMDGSYDRALRWEGPGGQVCYGRSRAGHLISGILASIPEGRFEPHHVIVRQQPDRPIRVALRWSYCGSHSGRGRYGEPTGCQLALLGISHFELRDGLIVNEWLAVDELAVYAQIAAYQTD
jgi:hypothetical protein